MSARPVDAPDAEVIQVIEVQFRRGKGEAPDDPVRMVVAYYGLDGTWLAERDDWATHRERLGANR